MTNKLLVIRIVFFGFFLFPIFVSFFFGIEAFPYILVFGVITLYFLFTVKCDFCGSILNKNPFSQMCGLDFIVDVVIKGKCSTCGKSQKK